MERKILTISSLSRLVGELAAAGTRVMAPVKVDDRVDFAPIASCDSMTFDYIATDQSAKSALFPRVETLFEMKIRRDSVELFDRDLDALPETVLLGTRPCDAAGLDSLTAIFACGVDDSVFAAQRKKTTVVSIGCERCDSKCFCTSVNGGPGDTRGSDILLTRLDNGDYLAEIVTDKGKALAQKHTGLFSPDSGADKSSCLASVPIAFDIKLLLEKIPASFDNPTWTAQSLRCIGCGACAFVCPACACFDIQDTRYGARGVRKRSWDSCGFSLFTLHASGHNPRETQIARWRQRVMHKFAYMPEREKVLGCTGCGRCGRACSVDMNLKEHLVDLAAELSK